MRYLKTFENLGQFTGGVNEIETFIKNNLAYILDEGFIYKVDFAKYGGRFNYQVRIYKIEQKDNNRKQVIFKWENIKDDFIPFLELLNDTYTLDLDSYSPEDSSLVIDTGIWNGPGIISSQRNYKTYLKVGIQLKKRWYSIEELIDDTVGNIDMEFISFTIKGKK
jgi:hypothetical protein